MLNPYPHPVSVPPSNRIKSLSKDYRADSLHILHIDSLDFFCIRRAAPFNDDGFVVQSDGVIAGGADTVWCGGTDENYSVDVKTPQNQIQLCLEKAAPARFDDDVIARLALESLCLFSASDTFRTMS